jgi:hypothetical protein
MQLLVPSKIINRKIEPFCRNGKPAHRTDRMNSKTDITIKQYNNEIMGLYNYYCMAGNVSKQLYRFQYFHYWSLVKTIALKYKLSLRQILNKFGIDVRRKQGTGTYRILGVKYKTKLGFKTFTYFNESIKRIILPRISRIIEYESGAHYKNELIRRLSYGQCEMCGYRKPVGQIEVHHIRKLKDLRDKYQNREDAPSWIKTMIKIRRKTLVLCRDCHKDIHKKHYCFS